MKWIGLTGGLGTGKSTVASLLQEMGYPVVDADEMARLAVSPGSDGLAEILKAFGHRVVLPSGELDRRGLGRLVFNDREKLAQLESIIHPRVKDQVLKRRQMLEQEGHQMAFYDVPLLFEKGMEKLFDRIIVVTAGVDLQIERTMKRDQLTREEVLKRLEAQIPVAEKARRADFVIVNTGHAQELKTNVQKVVNELLKAPGVTHKK